MKESREGLGHPRAMCVAHCDCAHAHTCYHKVYSRRSCDRPVAAPLLLFVLVFTLLCCLRVLFQEWLKVGVLERNRELMSHILH